MFGFNKQTTKKFNYKPTQSFLNISEIRDDVLIMQDGTLRACLEVSSTNFDLKNQQEQDALIMGYQRFLNSLEYPIQILMQSRRMDISKYIEKMKGLVDKQTNELLRIQTTEYIEFIDRLVETASIMNKNFYVIIPYDFSINSSTPGFFAKIFKNGESIQIAQRLSSFQKYKISLDERANSVASNLASVGLRVNRLNTDKIIELVYNSYNFEAGPVLQASSLGDIALEQQQQGATK